MNRMPLSSLAWIRALTLALSLGLSFSASAQDQGQSMRVHFPSSVADTLESPEREQWQQPSRVIRSLGVKPGDRVADIGAGGGYFSFYLANNVGDTGKVYAVDIQQGMLDYIQGRIKKNGANNIFLVKSTESETNLPAACCDKILMVNTWHELPEPAAFMKNLRVALRPGGTVAVINWKHLETFAQYSRAFVIEQMNLAGFTLIESHAFLERQYFLVFRVTH